MHHLKWFSIDALFLLGIYAAGLYVFAVSDQAKIVWSTRADRQPSVDITLHLQEMNVPEGILGGKITIDPIPDSDLPANQELNIFLSPSDRLQAIPAPELGFPQSTAVTLPVDGDVLKWPFDSVEISPLAMYAAPSIDSTGARGINLTVIDQIPGWNSLASSYEPGSQSSEQDWQLVSLTMTRSVGAVTFGIIILLMLVCLPTLTLYVAIRTYRFKAPAEGGLFGWIAITLFAIIPLRNFLPGQPPPGSWVDVTLVIWVLLGIVTSLILYTAGWHRHHKKS